MPHHYEMQAEFLREGFTVVRQVLTQTELSELHNTLDDDFASPTDPRTVLDGRTVKLNALIDRNVAYRKLVAHPALLSGMIPLLGPNIVVIKNRHNHATNNFSGDARPRFHRDILNWSRGLLSAIIYLDKATEENGTTSVIPGSHRLPFVGVTQPHGGGTWMDEHPVYAGLEEQAVSLPMDPGDALLFDATLFHSVGTNTTGHRRRSVAFGYRAVDELDPAHESTIAELVCGELLYRGQKA